MDNVLSNEELLEVVTDQKVLEKALGLSRSQAWRVVNGKSNLSSHARELVMLKLNIHPTFKLIEKV